MEVDRDVVGKNPLAKELWDIKRTGANMGGFVPLLYSIATDMRPKMRTILEIGVRGGTSTNAFLCGIRDRGHQNLYLYSIDIADCSGVVKDKELRRWWHFTKGDSKTVPWCQQIDVLLIDGDHSYEGVKADYDRFMPFVKRGGLILMHDVTWAHKGVVKFFWDEVKLPKAILPLSRSGMGVIYKTQPPYYDDDKVGYHHVG